METNKMSLKYEQIHTLPMRIYKISLIPTETLSVGPAKCLTLVMTFCLKKDDPIHLYIDCFKQRVYLWAICFRIIIVQAG